MKLTVDRSIFLKALSHGQSVVEKRTTNPILSHILLTATEGGLSLTSTDTDMALIESTPATVEETGSTTVSAHMLYDIVRKLPDGAEINMAVNLETTQIQIQSGRSVFHLSYLPAEEFPQITQTPLPFQFKLPVSLLRRLLDRTRFAMSTEETRYLLNGVHFHTINREDTTFLRAVATDGHRLAYLEVPAPEGAQGMPGIIIGRKTVNEIRKLLDESDQEVTIALSEGRVEFALNNAVLTSRLIDGTYPDYERVIPIANDKKIIFAAKNFAEAVDRVATVASDKLRAIKMLVQPNLMTLSAASHELGSGVEEMAVDYTSDASIEIGFNARYLLDIAQQIDEDEAHVLLANDSAPAIIRGMTNGEATYIIMPMRV